VTTEPSEGRIVATHRPPAAPHSRAARPSGPAADPARDLDPAGQRRLVALRELRNELRDGKPAYVVFDNKTLAAIARAAPSTLGELARIAGVGPAKLDRYGEAVLAAVAATDG
jgi:superfamily II DNA helicase RecQ